MQHIIFDFDGTIADSSIVLMNAWNTYAERYGYSTVNEGDITLARSMTIQQCAKKYHFPMHKLPIILPKIYRYVRQHIDEVSIYDGMKDTLYALHNQGHRLYILSSNDKGNIEHFLNQHQIAVFSEVFTSNRLFGKDRVLKKFMQQRHVDHRDILYIGDELRDIEACNRCQINFGWASWGLHGYDVIKHSNPALLFETPAQITEQLKDFKAGM